MADTLQQLRSFYEALEPARRRTLWGALVLSVATVAGVGVWASQPRYVTLTTPTDAEERVEVGNSLSRASIPWRIGPDGNSIEVHEEDQTSARSAATTDHGILGLEGLEQIDPWATPFVELLQKQRMLQGEIVRSINRMDGVARSACILNLPSGSEFIGRPAQATAAVTLSPEPGAVLDRELARTVAQFVAHAVAGMSIDDVSVVDTSTGRTLWSGGAMTEANAATTEVARQEAELAAKVSRVLGSVLGSPENFAVAVRTEVSTASTSSIVHSVDPDSAAPTREHIETEQNASTSGGSPGVDANLPERTTGTANGNSRSREQQETLYQYTRTETTTSQPAGELKRLSASVVVNLAALEKLSPGKPVDEAAEKARIEAVVKAALGIDASRGDTVVVELTRFAEIPLSDAEAAVPAAAAWEKWVAPGLALFAVLVMLIFVVRPLIKAATGGAKAASATPDEATPAAARRAGAGDDDDDDDERPGADVIDLAERLRRHVEAYKHISTEDLSELVKKEADNSAEVLRRWMKK